MRQLPPPRPMFQWLGLLPLALAGLVYVSSLLGPVAGAVVLGAGLVLSYLVTFRGLRLSASQRTELRTLTVHHYTSLDRAEKIMGCPIPPGATVQGTGDLKAMQGRTTSLMHAGFSPRAYLYTDAPRRVPWFPGRDELTVITFAGAQLDPRRVHWRLDGALAVENGHRGPAEARRLP